MNYSATAFISRSALRHNLETIRALAPDAAIMAMVKANAYGHGIVPVAQTLSGADSLAVARTDEAQQLRDAGIEMPIVLLEGVFDTHSMHVAAALGCELVVHTPEQIELLRQADQSARFVVWIKVDSGMNRLGFRPALLPEVRAQLHALSQVSELRLMSHFASADDVADPQTAQQLATLTPLIAGFDGDVSIANSPAALGRLGILDDGAASLASRRQWLRPGIALYGISPFADSSAASLGLHPVMNFETRLIAVREIQAGERVGYGGRFTAQNAMRIGIAAAGYGDGYPRLMPDGTPILVDGVRAAVAGRVSMDMLSIDLTGVPGAQVGSEVRMWGTGLPAETVAATLGTIAYELVTRVSERVTRVYI